MPRQITELAAFALVGVAASVTHFLVTVILVEQLGVVIWQANIIGFLVALPVSYFGHAFFTFTARRYGRDQAVTNQSMRRFTVTAVTGFAINQSSVVLFADWLGYPLRMVVFLTICGVAAFLFIASKMWAFSERMDTTN